VIATVVKNVADLPLSLKISQFHQAAKKNLQSVASVHTFFLEGCFPPGKHCPPARKPGDILQRCRSSPPGICA
jgi:hypothetical protein